ncbi:hypothetical protein HYE67_006495 [Fusarium culmorum]|uniref:BHLH domain-containing protein n=1 Tax=Fusarium culmorum TaxID=5516 RepID=A0A7S8D975_FUSCU|nr:hypothetical protein HYE67_006495 [Fusarium culmorum]
MATCGTMTDANTLHWGVENSQFELPVEYILGPPGQGLFAQSYAEFATMIHPNSSPSPTFASRPDDSDATSDACCMSSLDLTYQSTPDFVDGRFDPAVHTKGIPVVNDISTEIWTKEGLPHSSRDDTMEIHDIGDIAQQTQNDINKDLAEVKLRSASHKSKNSRTNSAVAPDVAKARNCHNKVEKQYRARLNTRFARLLTVLQASMPAQNADGNAISSFDANYAYSRGEVLDLATERFLTMQEENRRLALRVQMLTLSMKQIARRHSDTIVTQ